MNHKKTIAGVVAALLIPPSAVAHTGKEDGQKRLIEFWCAADNLPNTVPYYHSAISYKGDSKIPSKIDTVIRENGKYLTAHLHIFGAEGLVLQVRDDISLAEKTYVCRYDTGCEGPEGEGRLPLSDLMNQNFRSFESFCAALTQSAIRAHPSFDKLCKRGGSVSYMFPQADYKVYEATPP